MSKQKKNKINLQMLDLFCPETKQQTRNMIKTVKTYNTHADKKSLIDSLLRATKAIKSAARLVNVDLAIQLSTALETQLSRIQSESIELDNTSLTILNDVISFLQNTAGLDAEQLETPDEDTTQQLTQLKQQLDSIAGSQAHADQTTQAASNTLEDISFSIPDTIDPGMFDLLKAEMENNINILSQGILVLEENPDDIRQLEKLMRSSHSIKGAARMVNIDTVVKLAHAMKAKLDRFALSEDRWDEQVRKAPQERKRKQTDAPPAAGASLQEVAPEASASE